MIDLRAATRSTVRRIRPVFTRIWRSFLMFDRSQSVVDQLTRDILDGGLAPTIPNVEARIAPWITEVNGERSVLSVLIADVQQRGFTIGAQHGIDILGESQKFNLRNPNILQILIRRAAVHARGILETTKGLVTGGILRGAKEGTPPATIRRQVFQDRILDTQVNVVAEAELSQAVGDGLAEEAARAGVEGKTWRWGYLKIPRFPRNHHVALNGVTIPQRELFNVSAPARFYRTEYPRHPIQTPLWDLIACGCASIPAGDLGAPPWEGD